MISLLESERKQSARANCGDPLRRSPSTNRSRQIGGVPTEKVEHADVTLSPSRRARGLLQEHSI